MSMDYPPDDFTLAVRRWLADEIYPGLLGETFDDRAAAVWIDGSQGFVSLWIGGLGAGQPPATRLQLCKEELYRRIDRVAHPPAPGVHPDPLLGLRYGDRCFADANGPRLPVLLHAGDLIGQALVLGLDRVLPVLDLAAEAGYHGLRSWFVLPAAPGNPFWGHRPAPRWNPLENPGQFIAILQAAADRKLTWHLSAGGLDSLSNGQEDALFDLLATAIDQVGPQYFALVEACNEVRDTGDADDTEPAELERLVNRVRARHPQLLYSLSAYTGTEDREVLRAFTPGWCGHYYLHGYRGGRAHDKIRHLYSIGGEAPVVRRLGWQGEPFGPGRLVSAMDGHGELDAGVMQLAACMAAVARQAWTFMSGPGVILFDEPLESMPGFRETPAAVRQLPQDLMRFDILGHGGDRFRGTRIHAAVDQWRADFAIDPGTGRYVEVVYGPPEQAARPRQERQTTDVRRIVDCAWGYVETGNVR